MRRKTNSALFSVILLSEPLATRKGIRFFWTISAIASVSGFLHFSLIVLEDELDPFALSPARHIDFFLGHFE